MNLVTGKIFGFAPCIPISSKTGLSFLPNRLKAARDCQTSITRQPPGIGPAICASTPLTGQSASLFLLCPFNIILTLFSYLARDVAPRNSKRTPMGMGYLPVPVILEAYQRVLVMSARRPESGTYATQQLHSRKRTCTAQTPVSASLIGWFGYSATGGKTLDDSTSACDGFLFIHADADIPCLLYDFRALLNGVVRNAL